MKSIRMLMTATLLAASASLFASPPVNINTAGPEALAEAISGAGLKRAEQIVRDREKNGPYRSVDDLARVPGIGPRIIENNRQRLSVD